MERDAAAERDAAGTAAAERDAESGPAAPERDAGTAAAERDAGAGPAAPERDAASASRSASSHEVAVIVVSHDTKAEALACLGSARRAGAGELVLADSGSRDGTPAAVRAAFPEAVVLSLPNVGYGRAANAGVRRSVSPTLLVCNADVRFAADSLRRLAAALVADPALAAVGPAVTYPDGTHQASARRLPDLGTAVAHALLMRARPDNRFTRRYRALDVPAEQSREVDWLSGCALALRRRAFEDVAGFDPAYFLYVEDVDLGVRLRAAGWRLRYEPAARVTHRVGASTRQRRASALYHHARGLDRFYGRHLARRPVGRLARPLLRLALAGWVLTTLAWERVDRRRGTARSTTGERGGRA